MSFSVPAYQSVLIPWSSETENGLVLRGYHTEFSGKPLIHFLHGNGLNGLCYWPFLSQFIAEYDLILTDIQGHGDSDAGEVFLGWDCNAEMVAQVLHRQFNEALSKAPIIIGMGHSLGGVLTTLISAKNADLFHRLVLLDPVYFSRLMLNMMRLFQWLGLLEYLSPLAKAAKRRRTHWPDLIRAHQYFQGRGIFKLWHPKALDSYVAHGLFSQSEAGITLKCPSWIEAKIFSTFPSKLWHSIHNIKIPTDLLMGKSGYPFASKSARKADQINQFIHVEWVEGGHCFMQEKPLETSDFIQSILSVD